MNENKLFERIVFDSPAGTKDALDALATEYRVGRADVLREAILVLFEKETAPYPNELDRLRPDLPVLRLVLDAEVEEELAFLKRENLRLTAELAAR